VLQQLRISICAISILVASPALAGPFEDGIRAYKMGHQEEAIQLLSPLAEMGHVKAQLYMGMMHMSGKRSPNADHTKQFYWFNKAAQQGNTVAMVMIGGAYSHGRGVKKDLVEAVSWYRKAAEKCNIKAQFNLGNMYHKGEGVKKDNILAQMWWKITLLGGSEFGQNNSNLVAKKMTVGEMKEADKLAQKWMAENRYCLPDKTS
jgi:uncharacterized protein